MALVLVLGSHVAGSRVGGTVVSLALALGPGAVEPVHVPTTLLGRHPGWGPPGGGPVELAVMAGMIEGIAANGLFGFMDGVITGYATHPDQVAVMADAIDRTRTVRPNVLVLVDPVMGDEGRRYVAEGVAEAIIRDLVPRADVLTPNVTELAILCPGADTGTRQGCLRAARSLGKRVLVTSAPLEPSDQAAGRTAALWVDPAVPDRARLLVHPVYEGAPRGTGDLVAASLLAGLLSGLDGAAAAARATAVVAEVVRRSVLWQAGELSLVAARDALMAAPAVEAIEVAG